MRVVSFRTRIVRSEAYRCAKVLSPFPTCLIICLWRYPVFRWYILLCWGLFRFACASFVENLSVLRASRVDVHGFGNVPSILRRTGGFLNSWQMREVMALERRDSHVPGCWGGNWVSRACHLRGWRVCPCRGGAG